MRHRHGRGIGRDRVFELMAMSMIGDGILALVAPRRHPALWRGGPAPLRRCIDAFIAHPLATRIVGVLEAGLGLFWATRLWRR